VNHRQNTQKERVRYYGMGRERERKEMEGEGIALVLSRTVISGFDHYPKSTRDIATGHIYTKLF